MRVLPERPVEPERAIVHRLDRGRRYKRIKDRRIFVLAEESTEGVTLRPRTGRRRRFVPRDRLERDFIHVVFCAVCGHHHDVRDAMPHKLLPVG